MKINNRLKLIASLVNNGAYIMDVGCDHALLDIYLYKNKENINIIASDINAKPLIKAKENIKKYNLEDKIKLINQDGIKNIDKNVDTIIISGMGGILITNILENGDLSNIKEIILSPNNDIELVKKKLNKLNYSIVDEEFIKDKGKYYHILKYNKGFKKDKKFSDILIKKNNKDYKEYLQEQLNKNIDILNQLPKKYIFKRINIKINIKKISKYC